MLNPAVVFAETVDVMLPFEFEAVEPDANQFHDTKLSELSLTALSVPIENPSVPNAVNEFEFVASAPVVLDLINF